MVQCGDKESLPITSNSELRNISIMMCWCVETKANYFNEVTMSQKMRKV